MEKKIRNTFLLSMSVTPVLHDYYRIAAVKSGKNLSKYLLNAIVDYIPTFKTIADTLEAKFGTSPPMHSASVTIPPEVAAFVTTYAQKLRVSKSELMRMLIFMNIADNLAVVEQITQDDLDNARHFYPEIGTEKVKS